MSTDERQKTEDALRKPEGAHAPAPSAAPLPKPEPAKFPPHPPLPVGTQPLLDAQLGEALKIMRDYADWVHHPGSAMEDCMPVGDALARLMTASATLATVSARFTKGEPETRHRMIVEYVDDVSGPVAPKPSMAPAYGREGGKGGGGGGNSKTNKGRQ